MILRGARVRSLRPPVAALSGHGRAKLDLGARLWLVQSPKRMMRLHQKGLHIPPRCAVCRKEQSANDSQVEGGRRGISFKLGC